MKKLFNIPYKVLRLLPYRSKKNSKKIFAWVTLSSLLDVVGIASIMPLLGLLTKQNLIIENEYIYRIYVGLGFESKRDFLLVFGSCVFLIFMCSIAFRGITNYKVLSFVMDCEYDIGTTALNKYLNQEYEWFVKQNSSVLGKNIVHDVYGIVIQGLMPTMVIFSQGLVCIMLSLVLVFVNAKVALIACSVFCLAYLIIFFSVSNTLTAMGELSKNANEARISLLNDAFGSLKVLKSACLEEFFFNKYGVHASTYAKKQAQAQVLAQIPRFALEGIAFGGMLLLLIIFLANGQDIADILPLAGLYTMAGYKLLPALQQIYQSIAQLKFVEPMVDNLAKDIISFDDKRIVKRGNKAIDFNSSIRLGNVSYSYDGNRCIIENLSIDVIKNQCIGIVGESGSGKSTLIDLISGLLLPTSGYVAVDNDTLDENNRDVWKKQIGYVPQNPFLLDASIIENIAFGEHLDQIDMRKVVDVCKMSMLHSFVENELPYGYKTNVGENGVLLSGGQRQRIAIARALYRMPSVLILDEATSALDIETEKLVIDSIEKLKNKLTIIIVAHRVETLKYCDSIYIIKSGKVSGCKTFNEITANSKCMMVE